jgi:hypothetical protein
MTNQQIVVPLEISIVVSDKRGVPCLELRRSVSNCHTIKEIALAALNNKPIVVQPRVRSQTQAMASLIKKGICYLENDTLCFNEF